MKIESKVLVGSSKVEGIVVEIGEDSVLVEHMIMADGREKNIKQWYSIGVVEEAIEKVEVEIERKVKFSKKIKTEPVTEKRIELGVPSEEEKGDSDGE